MKLALIASCLFLVGCSQGANESDRSGSLAFSDAGEARKVLTGDQVVCDGECPPYAGALYLHYSRNTGASDADHRVKVCSATLIAPNKVLTNKHCIHDVLAAGDSCTDQTYIEIKFPKTAAHKFESFRCKKILETSADYFAPNSDYRRIVVPDWAIIELDTEATPPTERSPVTAAAVTQVENTPVELFPAFFDFSYQPAKAVIQQVRCRQVFNPRHLYAYDAESPLFRLDDCTPGIVHGNSESGVFLPANNRLVGVHALWSAGSSYGTMAHCLPGFSTPSDECHFSADPQNLEIRKAYLALSTTAADAIPVAASAASFDATFVEWAQEPFSPADRTRVQMAFRSPWDRYFAELDRLGHERMEEKLAVALGRLFFLRQPRCVQPQAAGEVIQLPLGNLTNWNYVSDIFWEERGIQTPSGDYLTQVEFRSTSLYVVPISAEFRVSTGREAVLTATGVGLPEALSALQIRLTFCAETIESASF